MLLLCMCSGCAYITSTTEEHIELSILCTDCTSRAQPTARAAVAAGGRWASCVHRCSEQQTDGLLRSENPAGELRSAAEQG